MTGLEEMAEGRVPSEPGSREPSPSVSAASGFNPSRGDVYVQAGVGFTCHTEWRTLSDGRQGPVRDFWTVGVYDEDDPSGTGSAEVEIIEVVPTQHCGTLVVHRRSFIDPDGERRAGKRKTSTVGSLRAYLKRWGFIRRDSDGSPEGRDAQRLDGEAATARAEGIAPSEEQS